MSNLRTEVPRDHRVSITYVDGSHSFRLASGVTLGELALRIGGFDTLHDHQAIMIEIALDTHYPPEATAIVASATAH